MISDACLCLQRDTGNYRIECLMMLIVRCLLITFATLRHINALHFSICTHNIKSHVGSSRKSSSISSHNKHNIHKCNDTTISNSSSNEENDQTSLDELKGY